MCVFPLPFLHWYKKHKDELWTPMGSAPPSLVHYTKKISKNTKENFESNAKCSDNLWNAKEPNPLPSSRQRRLWRGEWRKGRNSLHTKFSIDGGPCQVVWVLFTSNLSVLPAWKEFFSGRLRSFGRSIYSISLGQGLSCRQSQFLRISGSIRSSKMRVGLLNSVS